MKLYTLPKILLDAYLERRNRTIYNVTAETIPWEDAMAALMALLEANQISQRELSQMTGLSQRFLSYVMTGKRAMKMDTIMRCIESMGYDASIVVQRKKDWKLNEPNTNSD